VTVGSFLADRCEKVASQLLVAFDRIPSDKRDWAPSDSSRSAVDQLSEVAILNGFSATTIRDRSWGEFNMKDYFATKNNLASKGSDSVIDKFRETLPILLSSLREFPDEALEQEIETPFGRMKMKDILEYPFWNMSYHEGQINFIASMLGLLQQPV
jgi:hypothetical protein